MRRREWLLVLVMIAFLKQLTKGELRRKMLSLLRLALGDLHIPAPSLRLIRQLRLNQILEMNTLETYVEYEFELKADTMN